MMWEICRSTKIDIIQEASMSFKERRFWTCHNFHRSHSLCLSHKHMIIDHSTEAPIILKELRIRSWPGLKTHVHETTLVDLIRLHWRRCREVESNSICPRTIFQLYNCTVIYSDFVIKSTSREIHQFEFETCFTILILEKLTRLSSV